ncbi:MAG TPA: dihydrolipoamide acetyltransferase family protein [Candidatus Eremiobacteraceae bacterium]|nr:dihydrolipoamide acetyltransferase family protein [Candidatus Eremiobacteraceae bacterium]
MTMPQLGETVTEGTVGRWLKKVGDPVAKYEPLLEVETDKVASEIPSPFAGTLAKIHVEEGTTVPVGAAVCDISESAAATASSSPPPAQQPATVSTEVSTEETSASKSVDQSGAPGNREPSTPVDRPQTAGDDGVRYSPAVRKLAREHRLDLRQLSGSGRGGRLTAKDVLQHVESSATRFSPAAQTAAGATHVSPAAQTTAGATLPVKPAAAAQVKPASVPAPAEGDTSVRVTQMRKTIAEHMVLSKTTIPHAWSMVEADLTDLVKWRDREKEAFKAREGVNLTYLPVVVLAVCGALREFPMVNATWAGDRIIVRKQINVGIAVDIEDGLVVPVLREADHMSLSGVARKIVELVDKARKRKLTMEEMSDGTITVDNTGALGSIASYPIINPPQAAIITTEAIVKRPWVVNDAIAIRSIMNLCLSLDHRVLDGSVASRFLQSVKRRLESVSL